MTNSSLTIILIFAITGILLLAGCNPSPASQVPSETISVTPTIAITSTPTFVPTFTPSPTATATQLPSWVTDFAEPILSAIADTPPRVDDDMNDNSGGWDVADWCGGRGSAARYFINGEFVMDNCGATRSKMGFKDFVLEVDGRFLPGTEGYTYWAISFRNQDGWHMYSVTVNSSGFLSIGSHDSFFSPYLKVNGGFQNNHILLIAKGSKFALYVNGQPFYYWEDTEIGQTGSIGFNAWGAKYGGKDGRSIIALDNLKIWDISDLP